MTNPRMPDQDTPLKVMEGVVADDFDDGEKEGFWTIGGSDLSAVLGALLGKRIKLTIEILPDDG